MHRKDKSEGQEVLDSLSKLLKIAITSGDFELFVVPDEVDFIDHVAVYHGLLELRE